MSANGKSDKLTPKQEAFLSFYVDPKSETYGNALRSALKAGFSETYAKTITATMPDWLSDNLRRMKMLEKAERNLQRAMDYKDDDPRFAKIRMDASKFIAERIGRNIYSTKQEVEHKGHLTLTQILDQIEDK